MRVHQARLVIEELRDFIGQLVHRGCARAGARRDPAGAAQGSIAGVAKSRRYCTMRYQDAAVRVGASADNVATPRKISVYAGRAWRGRLHCLSPPIGE